MKDIIIRERPRSKSTYSAARALGLSHLQADILCRRSISSQEDLTPFFDPKLRNIPSPLLFKDCNIAAARIVEAVKKGENIGLVTDYDVDGLTAHAVAKNALEEHFGHRKGLIQSFVGSRLDDGYGLTEQICDRILSSKPKINLVVTADCGVSDEKRIAILKDAGIDVVVTDHHLVPKDDFPHSAYALVNPQQEDCSYPDKAISGCMVCWLVLSAVRSHLVDEGFLPPQAPTLVTLLDYVALATIADSVSLRSATNRAVVKYGLQEINTFARCCWRSMSFGNTAIGSLTEEDLAYQVSPRINGAGRMADPQLALDFLLADEKTKAISIFNELSKNNDLRKKHEANCMLLAKELLKKADEPRAIVMHHSDFHLGILGILASRLAENHGVPAVVFGKSHDDGVLTGSCRTAVGFHLLNILNQVSDLEEKSGQKTIISYGGHKGAAGVKINEQGFDLFRKNFLKIVRKEAENQEEGVFWDVDGSLEEISLATLDEINTLAPFGQHFEPPVFKDKFTVETAKFVGKDKDHLQLTLSTPKTRNIRSIWFRARAKSREKSESIEPGGGIECVYRLAVNEFRGRKQLQLCISHVND